MQGVAFQYNHGRSTLMWIAPLTLGETGIMHAAPEPPRFPLQLTGEIFWAVAHPHLSLLRECRPLKSTCCGLPCTSNKTFHKAL